MMKDEIVIDGRTYVLKKKLDSSRRMIVGEVMELVKFDGDVDFYENPNFNFKLARFCPIGECKQEIGDVNWFVHDTKFSKDYLKWALNVLRLMNQQSLRSDISVDVWCAQDAEGNWMKDRPAMLHYGEYGIIIAPRVDYE